jgi:hypothetical protein
VKYSRRKVSRRDSLSAGRSARPIVAVIAISLSKVPVHQR